VAGNLFAFEAPKFKATRRLITCWAIALIEVTCDLEASGCMAALAGTVSAALATPLGTFTFARFDSISDSVTGFGDLLPIAALRWNAGAAAGRRSVSQGKPWRTQSARSG
jgi:hypothetical protein